MSYMEAQEQVLNPACPLGSIAPLTACDCINPQDLGTTCVNGGFCRSDNLITFSCLCPPTATGGQCETTSSPACIVGTSNCLGLNSGCVSVQGATGDAGTCTCDGGFVRIDAGALGDACIPLTNECALNQDVCQNGGTCIDLPIEFMCTCPAGFTGTTCQTPLPAVSDEDNDSVDSASVDSASVDSASVDSASVDSASVDSASVDSASVDSASVDSASVDSASVDSASVDSASVDSASVDSAAVDSAS